MAPLLHEKEFVGQINIVGQHLPLSLHLETRVTCWQLALRMNKWQVRQVMQVRKVRQVRQVMQVKVLPASSLCRCRQPKDPEAAARVKMRR